jgi:hypothetical protein
VELPNAPNALLHATARPLDSVTDLNGNILCGNVPGPCRSPVNLFCVDRCVRIRCAVRRRPNVEPNRLALRSLLVPLAYQLEVDLALRYSRHLANCSTSFRYFPAGLYP